MNSSASKTQDGRDRSWGSILVAALALGVAASAIRAYVGIFYVQQNLDSLLVWTALDEPKLRVPGYEPMPIWGSHYFGDAQEVLAWGQALANGINPYDYFANYPPGVLLPIKLLALVDPRFVVIGIIGMSGLAIAVAATLLLRGMAWPERLWVTVLATILTTPFLAMLDRGNLNLLVAVLVFWAAVVGVRHRLALSGGLLGAAAALKLFPLLLMLWPLVKMQRRLLTWMLAVFTALTLLGVMVTPGSWRESVAGLMGGMDTASAASRQEMNYSSYGQITQVWRLVSNDPSALIPIPMIVAVAILGVMWLGPLLWLLHADRLPGWLLGCLSLITMQQVVPVAYPYACFGASIAAIWFINPRRFPGRTLSLQWMEHPARWLCIATLVASLTPIALQIRVDEIQVGLSPIVSATSAWLLLASAILANVYIRHRP